MSILSNEKTFYLLSTKINDCFSVIDASTSDAQLAEANERLGSTVEELAETPAEPGSPAWMAKLRGLTRYFQMVNCDRDGELPAGSDLVDRLAWSVLRDISAE